MREPPDASREPPREIARDEPFYPVLLKNISRPPERLYVRGDGAILSAASVALVGARKASGLGLGLPIARALARAMRGDLSFEDRETKAFRLELPVGAES